MCLILWFCGSDNIQLITGPLGQSWLVCCNQTFIQSLPGPSNNPGVAFQRWNSCQKRWTWHYSEILGVWVALLLLGLTRGSTEYFCLSQRPLGLLGWRHKWQSILYHCLDLMESFHWVSPTIDPACGSEHQAQSMCCLQNQKRPTKYCASCFMVQDTKWRTFCLTSGGLFKHAQVPWISIETSPIVAKLLARFISHPLACMLSTVANTVLATSHSLSPVNITLLIQNNVTFCEISRWSSSL